MRVHGNKEVAGHKLLFVALGFEFRNAHPDQTSHDSAGGGSDGSSTERGHDWAGRDEGTYARNGESADAG